MTRRLINRVASEERGVALVVVLAVIVVVLLLAVAVTGSSTNLRQSTSRNRNWVSAGADAQAGLDVGKYRLNQASSQLSDGTCIGGGMTVGSATLSGSRFCGPTSSATAGPSLAGNNSYTYWISKVLGASGSDTCGGIAVTYSSTVRQRCIISVGTSYGVTRRTAELVTAVRGNPTFVVNGIEALGGVGATENSKGSFVGYPSGSTMVAINPPASFAMKSCTPTPSVVFAPGSGDFSTNNTTDNSCASGIQNQSPPMTTNWPLLTSSLLDPWFQGFNGDTSLPANNDNSLLTSSGFTYTASTRTVTDTTNSVITLDGANPRPSSGGDWVLNLCKVTFTHAGTTITLTNGAVLDFLVDSYSRTVNGAPACPGNGQIDPPLTVTGVSGWNYSSTATNQCNYPPGTPGDPTALRLFVYGTGSQPLAMSNAQGFAGMMMAPGWNIKLTGGGGCRSVVWYGAIATNGSLTATNGMDFHGFNGVGPTPPGQTTSVFARNEPQGWKECATPYSASTPDAGC